MKASKFKTGLDNPFLRFAVYSRPVVAVPYVDPFYPYPESQWSRYQSWLLRRRGCCEWVRPQDIKVVRRADFLHAARRSHYDVRLGTGYCPSTLRHGYLKQGIRVPSSSSELPCTIPALTSLHFLHVPSSFFSQNGLYQWNSNLSLCPFGALSGSHLCLTACLTYPI